MEWNCILWNSKNKKDMKKKALAVILLLMMTLTITTGCGTDDIDISGYADSQIAITGIADKDVIVTIADLKALECKTIKTESTSDKIGVVRATGPTLETVLAEQGVPLDSIKKITFHGTDQYDYSLKSDYIMEHDIFLAFGIDGQPLDEESSPCRIIIPKSDSAYWLRMLDRIDIVLK